MSSQGHSDPPDTPSLAVLSWRLREARAAVLRLRSGPVDSKDVVNARHRLMEELESYVAALEAQRLPVPHRLRAELQLHEHLFDR